MQYWSHWNHSSNHYSNHHFIFLLFAVLQSSFLFLQPSPFIFQLLFLPRRPSRSSRNHIAPLLMLLSSHLTPSTSRSSRTQLTWRRSCDLSAPRPAAARPRPRFSRCSRQSLWRRGGGWSAAAEYEPKYCVNKISGHFRIQIFFMFHVNLHVQHRNHIFTSMSGTSRAMQHHMYSNAIGRHQRHTIAGMTCVHFRITVRTHMRIIIQHLQRIWRHSYTHQHTPMRFHIVTIHHASCHTSMKPQLNSWKQNCRKAKEKHSKIKSTKAKRHEAFLLSLLLLLTLLWQTWFHDFSYNHCR